MTNRHIRKDLSEIYDKYAQEREESEAYDWKVTERSEFLDMLRKENKRTLLEIGSGHGRDSLFFQKQGLETVSIDLSPAMVELCRKKRLDARVMDVTDLDFPPESFDAVFTLNSLLHIPKEELPGVLQNINAVLKPKGLFYFGVYGGNDFQGIMENDNYEPKRFFSYYTDDHLKRIINEVFDIIEFKIVNLEFTTEFHYQSVYLRKRPK